MDVIVFKDTHADLAILVILSCQFGFIIMVLLGQQDFIFAFEMKSHPNNDILVLNCYKSYNRKWNWEGGDSSQECCFSATTCLFMM